jgi:renal tumor antigen
MDMWGFGCVFFEMLTLCPLFPGQDELDQINKIHSVRGVPPPEVLDKFRQHASHIDLNFKHFEPRNLARLIPHAGSQCIDLINKMLAYDPDERISAKEVIRHPYFADLREQEKKIQRKMQEKTKQQIMSPSAGSLYPRNSFLFVSVF